MIEFVISEDAVYGAREHLPQTQHFLESGVEFAVGPSAIVSGQYANVVLQVTDQFRRLGHRVSAHVGVEIADMQNRETVKLRWQPFREHLVVAKPHLGGVATPAPISPRQAKDYFDDGVRNRQILEIEEG